MGNVWRLKQGLSSWRWGMKVRKSYGSILYAITILIILWEMLHLSLNSFVVPAPFEVILYAIRHVPELLRHLAASMGRISIGLGLTLIIGGTLGIALGANRYLDSYITPLIYLIYPVPRIAFLPVFMILFGLGDLSKIILIFAISVFHLIVSVRDSICHLPEHLFLTAKTWGLTRRQKLFNLMIPAALPSMFTSLKIAIGSSMVAVFFAENYATKVGIGYYIMNAWIKVDYVEMYSGIVGISLCGMGLFKLIERIERRLCKWQIVPLHKRHTI